jgi:F420-dependent oxidoreductase-like protein
MRLGINLGYWGAGNDAGILRLAQEADQLGVDVAFAAEAYGSDAATVLAFLAARTERIHLASSVFQIPARTPAMAAMTAATLDTLSGGRFRLGLGVSGPQVSEGWHGVRFDAPLARTREYVAIVRMALARERVAFSGQHYTLPLPDGPGKALQMTIGPHQQPLPIYLAAVGPKNVDLAAEIADGWLAMFFSPDMGSEQVQRIHQLRADQGIGTPFDVVANVSVSFGDDLEVAAQPLRPGAALYIGGMGSRDRNFYNAQAVRMGYPQEAAHIQDSFLARDYAAAAAAVPFELLDRTNLIGSHARVAERIAAFAGAGVGTLAVTIPPADPDAQVSTLRKLVEAFEASGTAT